MNPTAVEGHVKLVLIQWVTIMGVAWFGGRLAKRFGQPLAVGEILAGILLGPSGFGWLFPDAMHWLFPESTQQSLQLLAKIGLIFLMFQVGMEFDFGHLTTRSRTVLAVSVTGMAAPFLAGLLLGPWLHRQFAADTPYWGFQFFVCIALSISALPIMGRILLEMQLERTPLGVVAISAAAIDDVVGWILLAAATALVTAKFSWVAVVLQGGGVTLFACAVLYGVGPLLRAIWRGVAQLSPENTLPRSFLALLLVSLFLCAIVTNQMGVFSIFGAFVLGVALHQETTLARLWRTKLADFVLVALVPIFFANTGLRTEVGSLTTPMAWLGCGAVLLAATAGKFGGCWLGGVWSGQPKREAACVAALMNTRALMGLVAINIGADLGLLNRQLFTMFVIMALVTTLSTTPLLSRWLPRELRP